MKMISPRQAMLVTLAVAATELPALADEGMWLFSDPPSHIRLKCKHAVKLVIVALGPQEFLCRHTQKLGGNPDDTVAAQDRASQHGIYFQLPADRWQCFACALINHHRISGFHMQAGDFGQSRDERVRQTIHQAFLRRIT